MNLTRPRLIRVAIWLAAASILTGGAVLAHQLRRPAASLRSVQFWEPWDRLDGAPWSKPGLRNAEVIIPVGIVSPEANAALSNMPASEARSLSFSFDTNEQRLRGGPLPVKRPGVPRVLVIGGSVSFGWGVEDDETWPAQLERALGERGHQVQVINGAMPGVWSETSLLWCQRVAPELEPDLLIWARRPQTGQDPPYDGYAAEIAACQQAHDLPLLAVILPVCTFDPMLRYWQEEDRAAAAALERVGIPSISTTPGFREAARGRGWALAVEGSQYVVYDQESGLERLRSQIPPDPVAGQVHPPVMAPLVSPEGEEDAHHDELHEAPGFLPGELPREIYDLFIQDPEVHEVLFVDQGHPDPEGHALLAEQVADALIPMLGELDQERHAP